MSEQFSPAMQSFFEKLRATPRTWAISSGDNIRTDDVDCLCPMEAVAGTGPLSAITMAWRTLGLADFERVWVIGAADVAIGQTPYAGIRAILLDACGLSEPQP